jgi:hypothetical protein
MKKYNSTIKQKKCKCSGSCDKYPTMGYKGYYIKHFPDELEEKESEKYPKSKLKSDYIKMADIAFGNWIKKRDLDSQGNVNCVCCFRTFNKKDKDVSGSYIVQCLHFVPRGVYSLRYSEINCHAGCSTCNLDMHLEPNGLAYKRFRAFLVNSVGEEEVDKMELEKRNINKITEAQLKEIIEKYKK